MTDLHHCCRVPRCAELLAAESERDRWALKFETVQSLSDEDRRKHAAEADELRRQLAKAEQSLAACQARSTDLLEQYERVAPELSACEDKRGEVIRERDEARAESSQADVVVMQLRGRVDELLAERDKAVADEISRAAGEAEAIGRACNAEARAASLARQLARQEGEHQRALIHLATVAADGHREMRSLLARAGNVVALTCKLTARYPDVPAASIHELNASIQAILTSPGTDPAPGTAAPGTPPTSAPPPSTDKEPGHA